MPFPVPFPSSSTVGAYVPTSYIWDVAQLQAIEVNSPEFKELLVRLYQNITNIANVLNIKDSAYYDVNEFVNGQMFFPRPGNTSLTAQGPVYRNVYRKVFDFGALPNTATKTLAHGITITNNTTFTRIYATASDTTGHTYIPIPYAATTALADQVELFIDAVNINIRTGVNRNNFDTTYVILEYMQT